MLSILGPQQTIPVGDKTFLFPVGIHSMRVGLYSVALRTAVINHYEANRVLLIACHTRQGISDSSARSGVHIFPRLALSLASPSTGPTFFFVPKVPKYRATNSCRVWAAPASKWRGKLVSRYFPREKDGCGRRQVGESGSGNADKAWLEGLLPSTTNKEACDSLKRTPTPSDFERG